MELLHCIPWRGSLFIPHFSSQSSLVSQRSVHAPRVGGGMEIGSSSSSTGRPFGDVQPHCLSLVIATLPEEEKRVLRVYYYPPPSACNCNRGCLHTALSLRNKPYTTAFFRPFIFGLRQCWYIYSKNHGTGSNTGSVIQSNSPQVTGGFSYPILLHGTCRAAPHIVCVAIYALGKKKDKNCRGHKICELVPFFF